MNGPPQPGILGALLGILGDGEGGAKVIIWLKAFYGKLFLHCLSLILFAGIVGRASYSTIPQSLFISSHILLRSSGVNTLSGFLVM